MRIARIIFAVLLVMIGGLIIGCEGLSSVLKPPASEYPADIIGNVIVAKTVLIGGAERAPTLAGREYWIMDIFVKNKEYPLPIASKTDPSIPLPKLDSTGHIWIIKDGQSSSLTTPLVTVPQGQTGKITLGFEVVANLNPSNYQICYKGQQPYSYGKLVKGDIVLTYDWDLKKVTQVTEPPKKIIATVVNIWVSPVPEFPSGRNVLAVELKPNENAKANIIYTVDLYEKGKLRASAKVSWNQPEINVSTTRIVNFPVTKQEQDAYMLKDISHIFSAQAHE